MSVLDELLEAEDFAGDWYGEFTNQCGHAAAVGWPLALLLLAVGLHPLAIMPVVALVYGLGWEVAIQRGSNWRDSLMDTAHVASGAAALVAATSANLLTAALVLALWLALLAFGAWRRLRR